MENCKHCYCIDVASGVLPLVTDKMIPHKKCCNCGNKQVKISF